RFAQQPSGNVKSKLYSSGAPAFQRLVDEVVATAIHDVSDADQDHPTLKVRTLAGRWAESFGARAADIKISKAFRSFSGEALVRVRASVAHDAYERLVSVGCRNEDHRIASAGAFERATMIFEKDTDAGLESTKLREAAEADGAISEFVRFYL